MKRLALLLGAVALLSPLMNAAESKSPALPRPKFLTLQFVFKVEQLIIVQECDARGDAMKHYSVAQRIFSIFYLLV